MSKVISKFRLVGCAEGKQGTNWRQDPETKKYISDAVPVTNVDLAAVQGEPFGSATPQGSIKMCIQNPSAGLIFAERWHSYVHDGNMESPAPEFYVVFVPVEEADQLGL
jgi:hypothetical protein